jgi:3-hydroxyisobutyrate dehydrogenase/2-hydroxy-3-oxopropionate reductase
LTQPVRAGGTADLAEIDGGGVPVDRVAVVGTGRMGAAMVARLRAAGLPVVVTNRTRATAAAVAERTGATVADSAAAAAAGAGVVVVSLADDAAVHAAYRGETGLLAGLRPGHVVLETSTVDPDTIRQLQPAAAERGAVLLDAPVSGSVASVQQGTLTFMVGADPSTVDDAVRRARPVLDALGQRVFQLGPPGSGAVMKLAVNSLLLGLNQALAEALVLAERGGVDRTAGYDVFAASAVGAPFVQYKRQAYTDPEHTAVAFSLALVAKDLGLVERLADRLGVRVDQVRVNRQLVAEAIAAGLGDADLSALAGFLRTATEPAPAEPGRP